MRFNNGSNLGRAEVLSSQSVARAPSVAMPKRGASEMTHPPPKPRLILARDHAASIAVANECDALRDETEWRARDRL